MAKRTLNDIAAHIEREALRAGKRKIDGNRIASFSQELLSVGEGSLSEHLDIHPASGLYYYAILRKAQRLFELKRAKFDEWWNRAYADANERLIKKWGRRPNKIDVEQFTKKRKKNRRKYKIYSEEVSDAKRNVETINSYVEMWRQKSFSMAHLESSLHTEDDTGNTIREHMKNG